MNNLLGDPLLYVINGSCACLRSPAPERRTWRRSDFRCAAIRSPVLRCALFEQLRQKRPCSFESLRGTLTTETFGTHTPNCLGESIQIFSRFKKSHQASIKS